MQRHRLLPDPIERFRIPVGSPRAASARLGAWAFAVAGCVITVMAATPADSFVTDRAASPAAVESEVPSGEITPQGVPVVAFATPDRQAALDRSPAWRSFRERHGAWSALWNEATSSPHRAIGPGIALADFAGDGASADQAVRRFVAENTELFGAVTLRTLSVNLHGDVWYASYRQVVDGLDVEFSDWEFRVWRDGRLMMFGADTRRPESVVRAARIPTAVARQAATLGLRFDPLRDHADAEPELRLVPVRDANGTQLRPAYQLRVVTADPPGDWLSYVDAATGTVLFRTNRVREAVSGRVTAMVHPVLPTDAFQARPIPHAYVDVGPNRVTTDSDGNYSSSASGSVTVSTTLHGQYADVMRADVLPEGSGDASFSTSADDPATVDVVWGLDGLSHDAERDAYVNVNIAHDHVKQLEPGFTHLDYAMPLLVNQDSPLHCNAFWNGVGITFLTAGNGCVNTATVQDVALHEYGHGVNDGIYIQDGIPFGMSNQPLHEGEADLNAAFIQDDPVIGQGFTGPGTFVRDLSPNARWPQDNSDDVHAVGLIVAGAMWDLREAIGLPAAEGLFQQSRHGHPDDSRAPVAFYEVFLDVLVADDDDGNLLDGTPHMSAIVQAFNAHGIGTSQFLNISHVPIADQPGGGPVVIRAIVGYTGPAFSGVDPASPTLHYALDRGAFVDVLMEPTGMVGEYKATLPAAIGSVVSYYLTVADTYGGRRSAPLDAPGARVYRFLAGLAPTQFAWDMETDPGWIVGAPGDAATTGKWERVVPLGTVVGEAPDTSIAQPWYDHTPSGTKCWVTGNDTTLVPSLNDVDGGSTTLSTPVFNAVPAATEHPLVEYYRWFSNNLGQNPYTDPWRVDISNDGGATWTAVENTLLPAASWERVLFKIEDYVTPTSTMKLRFVATDNGGPSLIEAGVDDFRLLAFPAGSVGAPSEMPKTVALSSAAPNPSSGLASLWFSTPVESPVRLTIHDVAGRRVRTLVDQTLPAGRHPVTWDGRDDRGTLVSSGLYFARLEAAGESRFQRLLRTR